MREGPDIARAAALIADPARSAMLLALMDGRALTATELAAQAGVTRPTASSHLAKLVDGGLLALEAQGRHRYFRFAGPQVGALLEALMLFSAETPAPRLRTGPREPALRKARVCYDHLAGEMGVEMFDQICAQGWLHPHPATPIPGAPNSPALNSPTPALTKLGWERLAQIGITAESLPKSNRPLCRACLDWSMRRPHLAGRLGKVILDQMFALGWARRLPQSRVVSFTSEGERRFALWLR